MRQTMRRRQRLCGLSLLAPYSGKTACPANLSLLPCVSKPCSHCVSLVRCCAHRHGNAAALFVDASVDHFGMAMQPTCAGAVGGVEVKLDKHASSSQPCFNRSVKRVD